MNDVLIVAVFLAQLACVGLAVREILRRDDDEVVRYTFRIWPVEAFLEGPPSFWRGMRWCGLGIVACVIGVLL